MPDGSFVGGGDHTRVQPGHVFSTVFSPNPLRESNFRFRAVRMDNERAPKVILCNDSGIRPGIPCRARVKYVKKPAAKGRGYIVAEHLGAAPLASADDFYIDPLVAAKVQTLLEAGLNVLLDGKQGCGKTSLSRRVAAALGMEFVFFSCTHICEPTDLLATLQLRQSESGSTETVWMPTDVLLAIRAAEQHPGSRYLVLLDEFNRMARQDIAANAIMTALDTSRKFYNPITGQMLEVPRNVSFIAAVNRGEGGFSATASLDAAHLDRFGTVQMGYPPENEEIRILAGQYPGVRRELIERVVGIASTIRGDDRLARGLSMRATIEVCELLDRGPFCRDLKDPVPTLLRDSFCGRFEGRWNDEGSEAGICWSIVTGTRSRKGAKRAG
jgi:MoxR-like ATPase